MSTREPPQALDAERAVIGAILIHPRVFPDVALEIETSDFFLPAHREIYEAMAALDRRKMPVDLVALADELKARGALTRLEGGTDYLVGMAAGTPVADNVTHYAGIVRSKAVFRRAIELGAQIVQAGYDGQGDASDLVDRVGRDLLALTARRKETMTPLADLIPLVMDAIEQRSHTPMAGMPTGFWKWDDMVGGLKPEEFSIIAARPSVGKTSLCRCVARHVASPEVGGHALVFSLEESRLAMAEKWLVGDTDVDNQNVRRGRLMGNEWQRLHRAAIDLAKARIVIDDANGKDNTIGRIRAKCRRWRARHPEAKMLVVLDYLQLAETDGDRRENRAAEVAEISRSCKALAKEINAHVAALAQINRDVEKDKRSPRMSDLRESGSIEQDADQILFLHAEGSPAEIAARGQVTGILAKNRGGPTGEFPLRWLARHGRFENHEPPPDEPWAAQDLPGM